MDVIEAMETCSAARYLKPDPLPQDLIERVIYAATRASSPGNSQAWDFIVVRDQKLKRKIRDLLSPRFQAMRASMPVSGQVSSGASQAEPLLSVRDLRKHFAIKGGLFSREVDLIFTVTDHKGKFVTGLQQQDFGLLDDGRPPERVMRFQQQTNLPLRVGIMLDTSTSIRQRFQFEQQAATDFLLQVLRPEDRAFVEGFDVLGAQQQRAVVARDGLAVTRHGLQRVAPVSAGVHAIGLQGERSVVAVDCVAVTLQL